MDYTLVCSYIKPPPLVLFNYGNEKRDIPTNISVEDLIMRFLINGIYFQNIRQLGVSYRSEIEGGASVVINEALFRSMFFGTIFPHPHFASVFNGEMLDFAGQSVLFDARITRKKLTFTKKYKHRPDTINYAFERKDGLWVGQYSGEVVGTGHAQCILTKAPDDLFLPPKQ